MVARLPLPDGALDGAVERVEKTGVGVVWALLVGTLGDTTAPWDGIGSPAHMEASTDGSERGGIVMHSAADAKSGTLRVLSFMLDGYEGRLEAGRAAIDGLI
jgi:hypothetical protein